MASTPKGWVPGRREVIWIDFDPQAGKEMSKEHPLLVLSTAPFNERTGLVIGLPMTHAEWNESNPFALRFNGPKKEACYVLTHQPKSMDWRARKARPHPLKLVPPSVFAQALESLNDIISLA
ncbi:endoribonuclease MazF [soil metagenome]